jgi:hypothetical protein
MQAQIAPSSRSVSMLRRRSWLERQPQRIVRGPAHLLDEEPAERACPRFPPAHPNRSQPERRAGGASQRQGTGSCRAGGLSERARALIGVRDSVSRGVWPFDSRAAQKSPVQLLGARPVPPGVISRTGWAGGWNAGQAAGGDGWQLDAARRRGGGKDRGRKVRSTIPEGRDDQGVIARADVLEHRIARPARELRLPSVASAIRVALTGCAAAPPGEEAIVLGSSVRPTSTSAAWLSPEARAPPAAGDRAGLRSFG